MNNTTAAQSRSALPLPARTWRTPDELIEQSGGPLAEDSSPTAIVAFIREMAAEATMHPFLREEIVFTTEYELRRAGVRGFSALVRAQFTQDDPAPDGSDEELAGEAVDVDALLDAGRPILEAEDQLELVREVVREEGYAGDTIPVELLYLALGSRSLERPVNVAVQGPSAAGKSFTVETALSLHPPEAAHLLTASSERALIYSDENFAHRYVVVAEATGLHREGIGATVIRSLAWGEAGIRYETVSKSEVGELQARVIEKLGPTGLITTTTRALDPEVATRMLCISVKDTPDQTRSVLASLAKKAEGAARSVADKDAWHAAHRWLALQGTKAVIVPFATALVDKIPADRVRLRRDVEQLLTAIRVHAFLHQRKRRRDDHGRVLADRRDYEAAHELLADVFKATVDGVSETIRATVQAVRALLSEQEKAPPGVSYPELAAKLNLGVPGAHYRGKLALKAGYLTNAEERRGYSARLILGDPLPEDRSILPAPQDLFASPSDWFEDLNTPSQVVVSQWDKVFKPVSEREGAFESLLGSFNGRIPVEVEADFERWALQTEEGS